jgi:hypothetical protein
MLRNEVIAVRKRFTDEIRPWPRANRGTGASAASVALNHDRELRDFFGRIFGWCDERRDLADDAMRTLLTAITHGTAVALRGESDLVPIAYTLHRRLLGAERPFIVCDPRRRDGAGSLRSPPNLRSGMEALLAAAGGSVCIRACRLPTDFDAFAASVRGSGPTAQVFMCLSDRDRIRDLLSPPLEIPALAERQADLDRLISECLADATRALGVERMRFSGRAPDSILHGVTSLAELERSVLRLVALKLSPNLSQAARRLRVSPVSLSRWVHRRRFTSIFNDVACLEYEDDGPQTPRTKRD